MKNCSAISRVWGCVAVMVAMAFGFFPSTANAAEPYNSAQLEYLFNGGEFEIVGICHNTGIRSLKLKFQDGKKISGTYYCDGNLINNDNGTWKTKNSELCLTNIDKPEVWGNLFSKTGIICWKITRWKWGFEAINGQGKREWTMTLNEHPKHSSREELQTALETVTGGVEVVEKKVEAAPPKEKAKEKPAKADQSLLAQIEKLKQETEEARKALEARKAKEVKEAELKKKKAEEERRQATKLKRKKEAEEKRRLAALKKKKQEADRRKAEEEKRRIAALEKKKKQEAARQRAAEQKRKKVAEEKRRLAALEKKKQETARRKAAELKRKKETEEKRRLAALEKKKKEEVQRVAEAKRKAGAERKKKEEQQRIRKLAKEKAIKLAKLQAQALAKQEENAKKRQTQKKENKYAIAVIIGNKNYTGRTPSVEFAHNDADAMRKFVTKVLGYREGNIINLRDASQAQMIAVFGNKKTHEGKLYNWIRPGKSDVTVFYSGHGVPGLKDRRGYLLPVDADPNLVELNGYPVDVLYENLVKVKAKSMTVYLDACFSGDSPKGMIVRAISGISVKPRLPEKKTGLTVLTAAQGDQFASWDEDAKMGLFTKNLLDALNGAADGEGYGNSDGEVTLKEVQRYLDEEMSYQARRRYNREQKATVMGNPTTVLSTVQ